MENKKPGILPFQELTSLIESNAIDLGNPPDDDQIQPASIDLRLGSTVRRVRASYLPGKNRSVRNLNSSSEYEMHEINITDGAVLETGCVYIAELQESLNLPKDISATTNPKSSTGRLDIFTRVIADNAIAFDSIPRGYSGNLHVEICPKSFPVLVKSGSRLSQIRFRRGDAKVKDGKLKEILAASNLQADEIDVENGLKVSIDLEGKDNSGIVGYRAKRHSSVIDVSRKAGYDRYEFWEPITVNETKSIILDPNEFYILVSKESVVIPPDYAAEMLPIDPMFGEFRVHYAGFFDPGFGYSESGGGGSRAVLEVRSHDVPFILEHGQTVGRLIYEHMSERPEVVYGQDLNSNYQGQSLKLSKHFKN